MTKQQKTARKAVKTATARRAFQAEYGRLAYDVVMGELTGRRPLDLFSWPGSEAAWKANLNRPGKFRTMALACVGKK
jgi:hypothetical protein